MSSEQHPRQNGRRRSLPGWLIAIAILVLFIGAVLVLLKVAILPNAFAWTGEEEPAPQIAALWHLVEGQVRARPETRPDVPVAYTGQNPFGANTFLEQEVEPAKRERVVKMLRDAGFQWIRQEFPWEDIEIHGKGDFEDRRHEPYRSAWDKYDNIVDLAERHGMQLIVRLTTPPAWSRASGKNKGTLAPPDSLSDYADFVRAVVSRYKGRVGYYQIWNEPNIYPEWGEAPVSPEDYTEMLKAGYQAVKEADPEAVVLAGALAATIEMDGHPHGLSDFVFLQRMYDAGAKDYFDVLAVQGYGLWSGPTDRRMRPRVLNFSRPEYIRDIMVKNGDAHKPIWMTEMNWNAIPADHPAYPMFGRVSEQQQAEYAALAYRRAQEEWPWLGVINVWFFKRATDLEKDQPMYYFRMVEPDFTPLPVYDALGREARRHPVMYPGYHPEDHWAVEYAGQWRHVTAPGQPLAGYEESRTPGDRAELIFVGTELDVSLVPAPQAGRLSVSCDGRPPVTLSAAGTSAAPEPLAACSGLPDGPHEARLQVQPADGGGAEAGVRIGGYLVRRSDWAVWGRWLGLAAVVAGCASLAAFGVRAAIFR